MFLALLTFFQVGFPAFAWALTSGPSQPEFSSFEPVGTVKMVDEFTGDMTYNLPLLEIPGPEGSSYPISLSYHSGAGMEEDASWVGYGWTLNPGAIQRGKAGLPDDFRDSEIKEYNDVPANWTVSAGYFGGPVEIFSNDLIGLNLSSSIRYNNYRGFGYVASAGATITGGIGQVTGTGSLGYSYSDGDGAFSFGLNVARNLGYKRYKHDVDPEPPIKFWGYKGKESTARGLDDIHMRGAGASAKSSTPISKRRNSFSVAWPSREIRPTSVTPYTGLSFNTQLSTQINPLPVPFGVNLGIEGYFSRQQNKREVNLPGFGYLYSHEAGEEALMDYYLERQSQFEVHDKYMAIPFSAADNFAATGEAIGGGFRLHNTKAGYFHPNEASSRTIIANLPVELSLGQNFGLGADVGVGYNVLHVHEWENFGLGFDSEGDEPYYFSFTGDKGGHMEPGDITAQAANVYFGGGSLPGTFPSVLNPSGRVGRSTYIGYNTNQKMLQNGVGGSKPLYAYTHDASLRTGTSLVDRSSVPDGIGEISIVNSHGLQQIYALPVYSRGEHDLGYLVQNIGSTLTADNYLAYKDLTKENARYMVGREVDKPYAAQYLLTEVRQPDYVDRTMDGPTEDDFGGWTKFHYDRHVGSGDKTAGSGNWYKWRMPYNGLAYDRGELSTKMDDRASVTYGEKEIYYLEKVETRTHYAVFETDARNDGLDAAHNESVAANSATAQGTQTLKKLNKIKLYRKQAGGDVLMQVVNFQYDYSAWAGCGAIPNSSGADGKLTLRRVWIDYEGAYNARISPYEFYYQYPRTSGVTYPSTVCSPYSYGTTLPGAFLSVDYPPRYDHLENYGYYRDENPAYEPRNLDPWGGYQMGGAARYAQFRTWENQNPVQPNSVTATIGHDPAAYQLKAIKLPSGGQIHLHYEQDDYAYVQDRHAMAMVRTVPVTGTDDSFDVILPEALGTLSTAEVDEMVRILNQDFVVEKEKIYFKFLYSLIAGQAPDLILCGSEWIDGYATVKAASRVGSNIRIQLEGGTANEELPLRVCKDFVKTQRHGMLVPGADCDASNGALQDGLSPGQLVQQFLAFAAVNVGVVSACGDMDPDNSYFRIPVLKKLGGGLRVKRVLMYDQGIEAGGADRVLYGTEYSYTNEDGTTSGVATREPVSVRFEDPVINVLDRKDQSLFNRIVTGKDRTQLEGPLGETILPSASVGYERVVSASIHSGKTSPGFTISEFYTVKEYPFDQNYPAIDQEEAFAASLMDRQWTYIPEINGLLPITFGMDHRKLSQGYRFVCYDIHGSPKAFGTYAGTYNPSNSKMEPTDLKMISYQEMSYYKPGESLPIMYDIDNVDATGWYPGKEVDVTTESRQVDERYLNGRVENDVTISLLVGIPLPVFGLGWNLNYSDQSLKSFVTSKVIRYPAIQRSIKSYQDGIWHNTEHLYFNPENGQPVVTRTTDSYDGMNLQHASPSGNHDGSYRAYSIPASRQYKAMGQKASNERMKISSGPSLAMTKGTLTTGEIIISLTGTSIGAPACEAIDRLTSGSKVLVTKATGGGIDGIYNIGETNGATFELLPSAFYSSNLQGSNIAVNIEILESGKQNRLEESVGGFTTYGVPASVVTTPVSPSVISTRETLYVNPLNTLLVSIAANTVTTGVVALASQCELRNAHSPEAGIRLTKQPLGGGAYHVLVELIDWRNSAQVVRCSAVLPNFVDGEFAIDPKTAEIVFLAVGAECAPYQLPCLEFCANEAETRTLDRVVVASAATMSDHWPFSYDIYGSPQAGANAYESGEKGKWRVDGSYQFRKDIVGGAKDDSPANERNYKGAGTFMLDLFDYANLSVNDPAKWLRATTVTQYTPHGMAVEERNIINVYSNAHFGYNQTVPMLSAQNAAWNQCYFESFEMLYGSNKVEEGVTITPADRTTSLAHSGKYGYQLAGSTKLPLRSFVPDAKMISEGFSLQAWVYDPDFGKNSITADLHSTVNTLPLTMVWQARVGNWNLYEAKIPAGSSWGGFVAGDAITPRLSKASGTTGPIRVDDVRYQPLAAQMNCFVYDPSTLKMTCTFDDQHFGVYNQYNGEGRLVRKLIETERGMRTVQESNNNTPSLIRPQ